MKNVCYVSGKDVSSHDRYSFGDTVILPLTQDVFAHFIIRAGNDPEHQKVMNKLKTVAERAQKVLDRGLGCLENSDVEGTIETEIEAREVDTEMSALLVEKARSGVRILRKMKEEFRVEGRLSS